MSNENETAVVAICKTCEGIVLSIVSHRADRKDKNRLGQLAADGYEVRTVDVETVRKSPWCECKKGKKK